MDSNPRPAYRDGMNPRVFLSLSLLGLLAWAAAVPAKAGPALVPHQAVYDIRLDRAAAGGAIVGAVGRAVYRVEKACGGWLVENRTSLLIRYEGDQTLRQIWSQASWEADDGRAFRSRVVEYRPDGANERTTSRARLGDGGGEAIFTEPERFERSLPEGTRFPMAHLAEILDVAAAGKGRLRRVLFDGGNTDNPYTVNVAVLGDADPAKAEVLARRFKLEKAPGWRLHMAFFPHAGRAPVPDYEVTGSFRADGVAYDLVQDFGTFGLGLRLEELTLLDPPNC